MLRACWFLLILSCTAALAHGPAEWIQRGGYKNGLGELCCGERDCAELPDGEVVATAAGYRLKSSGQVIPYYQAQPSPDGRYWKCVWGGQIKCFFAPPPGS